MIREVEAERLPENVFQLNLNEDKNFFLLSGHISDSSNENRIRVTGFHFNEEIALPKKNRLI
jgi:hypothetical protein